jgi:hypothetical protein
VCPQLEVLHSEDGGLSKKLTSCFLYRNEKGLRTILHLCRSTSNPEELPQPVSLFSPSCGGAPFTFWKEVNLLLKSVVNKFVWTNRY